MIECYLHERLAFCHRLDLIVKHNFMNLSIFTLPVVCFLLFAGEDRRRRVGGGGGGDGDRG